MRRRKENHAAYFISTPRAGPYVCSDVLLVVAVRCRVRGDALPLFGALAISVSRLAIASIVVGSAVWLAARWRTRRGGEMPPGALSWSKEQWRAVIIFGMTFGLMNGFFYCAIDHIPIGLAVAVEFLGPLALASMLTRRLRDAVWVLCALAGMLVLGYLAQVG